MREQDKDWAMLPPLDVHSPKFWDICISILTCPSFKKKIKNKDMEYFLRFFNPLN